MNDRIQIEKRLSFMDIDNKTRSKLRELSPIIKEVLPQVLSDFYDKIRKEPEVARFFQDNSHIDFAKNAQFKHWVEISEGTFSSAYIESVRRIGLAHAKIGLEPRWYIAGYTFIISAIQKHIIELTRSKGLVSKNDAMVEKAQDLIEAFNKAAMLDMDFAISIYLDEEARKRKQSMSNIASTFEETVSKIVETVAAASTELSVTAKSMEAIAESTSNKATTVAAAAEEATTNVGVVASSSEELSSSVSEIASQVANSTRVAGEAVLTVQQSASTIQNLSEAADKIGTVVSMISDIASQTNLLALNATIESARAGEAGKGFAVVASEVKSLAGQTAKATEDISRQINEMQSATKEAVSAITSIQKTIDEINSVSMAINAAVEEQAAATAEIMRNTQEASHGTRDVSDNISFVQGSAEETGNAASEVVMAADELSRQAEVLRREVSDFVNDVRAA